MNMTYYRPLTDKDNGSATITALIVVGVATVLISGLLWRQQLQIHSIENTRDHTQVIWLQKGLVDFARLVLAQDIRSNKFDHLGEAWSLPLNDGKVTDFLKKTNTPDEFKTISVNGGISDAQGLFNLSNLWVGNLQGTNPSGILSYSHLLKSLGLDPSLAQQTAQIIMQGQIPLSDIRDLIGIPGYSASTIATLRPHLTILPNMTTININTASPEVLMAALYGLSRSSANNLVLLRATSPAKDLEDAMRLLSRSGAGSHVSIDSLLINTHSQYWFASSEISLGSAIFKNTALIYRSQNPTPDGYTHVVWTKVNRILSE